MLLLDPIFMTSEWFMTSNTLVSRMLFKCKKYRAQFYSKNIVLMQYASMH